MDIGLSGPLRAQLRAATESDHIRIDALAGRFDLESQTGYAGFLLAQMRVLPAIEAMLLEGSHLPEWTARHRTAALASDLAALNITAPGPLTISGFDTKAALTGAAYVLEGSRLGAAVQCRIVARSQPNAPRAFLSHGAGRDCWRQFLRWLEMQPRDGRALAEMIAGARATFAAFAQAFET